MEKHFYITTTLPYANGKPHVGHTMEFIRADIIARHKRLLGHKVFFNTGMDEHGQKIAEQADSLEMNPQEYVDGIAKDWRLFCSQINMSYDSFSRTTSKQHKKAAAKLWEICAKNGYIYKRDYQSKYCVGCELEKQDSDLEDGVCPDHPTRSLELIDEENYFFAISKLQDDLIKLYDSNELVVPDFRLKEIRNFVESGLHDFSISRLKEKMPWGVSVPGDDAHVMYVWFDALANYISCLGWGSHDDGLFSTYWTDAVTVQFCGKDNLRQQSAIWQAMLLAAGITPTDTIFVEGHIMSGGSKMSKSVGNVVDPMLYLDTYGADAVRYYIARHLHNVQDADWTRESFHEAYQANLVNGIGNLTNRILKMSSSYGVDAVARPEYEYQDTHLDTYDFNGSMDQVFKLVGEMDQFITDEAPFKKVKVDPAGAAIDVQKLLGQLWQIAGMIQSVMPDTYIKMIEALAKNEKPEDPLFPRIELQN